MWLARARDYILQFNARLFPREHESPTFLRPMFHQETYNKNADLEDFLSQDTTSFWCVGPTR